MAPAKDKREAGSETSEKTIRKMVTENGYIDEDVDDDYQKSDSRVEKKELSKEEDTIPVDDQEFIFIHEDGLSLKISSPGLETFEIQASAMEAVQEIHHLLMEREDTCSRTCFSLTFEGQKLDRFADLKSIPNLKDGSLLKVVEEPYTVREARIHLRHIRDLLRALEQADAFNGQECRSMTHLNTFSEILDAKRSHKAAPVDCTPPSYIVPDSEGKAPASLPPISHIYNPVQTDRKQLLEALKVLSTSGWNPPPGSRKLHGDLLYLHVITVENKRFHITCCTKGFFVNQSSDDTFNPASAPSPNVICHSLVDLLSTISPTFKRNFVQIQKRRREKHPFERVATPYQVYTWTSPTLNHIVDSIRAEDASSSKLGYEEHLPGQTRDWNEELQTIRKLPRKTLPQRLIRERAMFKVHSDFVAAASRGAMAVVDGNVMAINPGVEKRLQMFIWHGIFFSLGFDVADHYKDLGGDNAAFVAPSLDLQGVVAYNRVDPEDLYTVGTVVIDYRGYRVAAQTIIPGIMDKEQEESVVYGSVDFGRTVVSNEKYLELLDKCAKQLRIKAHSVLNEKDEEICLYSSVESKGIIGNDGRYYILDLLHTFPPDVNYLEDANQSVCKEVSDAGYPKAFKHKLCCLRQGLLDDFHRDRAIHFFFWAQKRVLWQLEKLENPGDEKAQLEYVKAEFEKLALEFVSMTDEEINADQQKMQKQIENSETKESKIVISLKQVQEIGAQIKVVYQFNPDAFSPLVRHSKKEDLEKQRQLIRTAADFLLLEQLPRFVIECKESPITILDGITLAKKMHERDINIRYLGYLVKLFEQHPQLAYLRSIAITEILCRSAKHVFNRYLQTVDNNGNLAIAIATFLNCLLSSCENVNPLESKTNSSNGSNLSKKNKKKKKIASSSNLTNGSSAHSSSMDSIHEWIFFTPALVFELISEDMQSHYAFKTNANSLTELFILNKLHKTCILRNFCIKVGLQLHQQDYDMDNCEKPTFSEQHIMNIFPVVKHPHPIASDAYHFYNTGLLKLHQGDIKGTSDLLCEALNLMNNVYGAMHHEIVPCLRSLARIHYYYGQYSEAVANQQKAVLMCEKVNGVDSAYCVLEYVQLALYCFANRQCTDTLQCLYRAKYLLLLMAGPEHPEHGTLDANIGIVLQTLGEHFASVRFLKSALRHYQQQDNNKSLKMALLHHMTSVACSSVGECREALQNEIEAYRLYKQKLGEEHEKTMKSSAYLKVLTNQAVQAQKRQKGEKQEKTVANTKVDTGVLSSSDYENVLQALNAINGMVQRQLNSLDFSAFEPKLLDEQK